MDFTAKGEIIAEDNGQDGEVLGYAFAVGGISHGDNGLNYEEMRTMEVDIRPGAYKGNEVQTVIRGLLRMGRLGRNPELADQAIQTGGPVMAQALERYPHIDAYIEQLAVHNPRLTMLKLALLTREC